MRKIFTLAVLLTWGIAACAQGPLKVRGTVTAIDGHLLTVQTHDGSNLRLAIDDKTQFSLLSRLTLHEVKRGNFVGITAVSTDSRGRLQAREVHVFPESQRGAGEGHYPWDLEPGATMTNGNIDISVTGNDGKALTVSYKGGRQKINVPTDAIIVSTQPADASAIQVNSQIFAVVGEAKECVHPALYIAAGKDGLKPPM